MGLHEKKRLKQQRQQTLQRTLKYAGIFALASTGVVGLLLLVVKLAASTKEDFLADGDAFIAQEQYPEAIIAYRNAVELDPNYGQARYQLAKAYLHQGQLRGAMGEYIRAADLLPGNVDAQLQAAKFLLITRRFDDAKARAEKALERDPKNVEAQITKATAVAKMVDLEGGLFEIQQAIRMDPKDSRSFMILGAMKGSQRNLPEAEAAFKRAVDLAPKSLEAQLALALFYWRTGRLADAETWLRRVVDTDPTQLNGQRRLAGFLVSVGRASEAEAPLKRMAESTRTTAAQLILADYYLGQGRSADARGVLTPMISGAAAPDAYEPARTRLARLDYAEGRRDEAHVGLRDVLKRDPKDLDALVLSAQFFLAERDIVQATRLAQEAVAAGPTSADARLVLSGAFVRRHQYADAIRVLNEAVQLNPLLELAKVRLVQLQLLKGDIALAVRLAEDAVRTAPDSVLALSVRATARAASGDLTGAERDLAVLLRDVPELATVHVQIGEVAIRRKNLAAAHRAFDRALQLAPSLFDAHRGKVTLDILEKRPERALATVEQLLTSSPNDTALLMLAASVHAATGDLAKREAVLQRIVEIDANDLAAQVELANLFVDRNQLDKARVKFEALASGPNAVGAQTMLGLILETQKKKNEAKAMYEKVVDASPDAMVAANNLAWLYAESDTNLDRALELAQNATRQRPDSAEFNHTLGTIYMKKGLTPSAVRAHQMSVKADPANIEYRYSLALAYAKNGDRLKAAEELRAILKGKPDYRLAQLALEELTTPKPR
jgi:tetratricopeptide (TPR) repeat protein